MRQQKNNLDEDSKKYLIKVIKEQGVLANPSKKYLID